MGGVDTGQGSSLSSSLDGGRTRNALIRVHAFSRTGAQVPESESTEEGLS
jgi:hypothetical protein